MEKKEEYPCAKVGCRYYEKWITVSTEKERILLLPGKKNWRRGDMVEYIKIFSWCRSCCHFIGFNNFRE